MRLDTAILTKFIHWILSAALAAVGLMAFFSGFRLEGLLVALAAMTGVTALARQLPLQNVLLAAAITALMGGVAHGLSARVHMPFGPMIFDEQAGPKLFNAVPWTIPLLWLAVVFHSRGVARIILRPWRKLRSYGYWLIAFTAVLALMFDMAMEPYATRVKHFWRFLPTKLDIQWHSAPILNFIGWIFVVLMIMAFVTPSLIRKQPGNFPPPDYHPLAVWMGGLVLFSAGAAQMGMWSAVTVNAVMACVVGIFCWRGARW